MKKGLRIAIRLVVIGAALLSIAVLNGCGTRSGNETAILTPTPSPSPSPSPSPTPGISIAPLPVTMPMLDALLQVDETFSQDLKTRAQLTDEQFVQLKALARDETAKLREDDAGEVGNTTTAAGELATQKLTALVGTEKAQLISTLAMERWSGGAETGATGAIAGASPLPTPSLPASSTPLPLPSGGLSMPSTSPSPGASPQPSPMTGSGAAYNVPLDSRIVINAPAYRMDVFENGRLLKSYKVGIGYPEFPVPNGLRKASSIIFNPTWTPPDEPWVESSKKVKVGEKIGAGEALNPLGVVKIPIGLPSLIHGGKRPARLGGFASHGCVGMTDEQIEEFSKDLAQLGGLTLTDQQIADYEKARKETKVVKLSRPVPVEIRYDTIVVSDGELHIYRDVYDRDTNTEANLWLVLEANGVTMNDLTEKERTEALKALDLMSTPPSGRAADKNLTPEEKQAKKEKNIKAQRMTTTIKGRKEIVIPIAALAGKGYPAPVDLNTGGAPEEEKSSATRSRPKAAAPGKKRR